jgi:hypothetical protein
LAKKAGNPGRLYARRLLEANLMIIYTKQIYKWNRFPNDPATALVDPTMAFAKKMKKLFSGLVDDHWF